MRGEKEQQCLNIIREAIFTNKGQTIYHPFTGKTYQEVSDKEFEEEQIWFTSCECTKNYFGLCKEDRNEIEQILRMAKPNTNLNDFPDFVFNKGFIEHFQITSSQINKKGAVHIRKQSDFQRKVGNEIEKLEKKWDTEPSFDKVRSESWIFQNPVHSYDFLIKSFKHNWEHHMKSYKNYSGEKQVGIFMIEYTEMALAMTEDVYCDWINGMSNGDMREPEKYKEYRLSRDKTLLEYIYQFRNEIKYIIFINYSRYEIICTENIPYLIKLMPWKYAIYPMQVMTVSGMSNISVPVGAEKDGETDTT